MFEPVHLLIEYITNAAHTLLDLRYGMGSTPVKPHVLVDVCLFFRLSKTVNVSSTHLPCSAVAVLRMSLFEP